MATDYILMLCLSSGIPIHVDNPLITDKRCVLVFFYCQIGEHGFDVYRRLAFETSVNNFFDRLEVLPVGDVVVPFKLSPTMDSDTVASRTYNLFHRLINLPSFGTDYEALKWETARHALTLACGRASYNPTLEGPDGHPQVPGLSHR